MKNSFPASLSCDRNRSSVVAQCLGIVPESRSVGHSEGNVQLIGEVEAGWKQIVNDSEVGICRVPPERSLRSRPESVSG